MVDIKKVEKLIEYYKNKTYSFGEYDEMSKDEEMYYACVARVNNKLNDDEFILKISNISECPDVNMGIFEDSLKEQCHGSDNGVCVKCWIKALS